MAEKINYETREAFDNYLFTKGYLVNWDGEDRQDCVRALYALGSVYGIKIVRNPQLTVWSMVRTAQNCIGEKVPTPFYIGFPKSVAKLTEEEQIIDRMIHYAVTYGLGDFSQPGHSVLEEEFERLAFREHTEPKEFEIVEEKEALPEQKQIKEINTGNYCVEAPLLFEVLKSLGRRDEHSEYYLTDLVALLRARGEKVSGLLTNDSEMIMGVNSPEQLAAAEEIMQRRFLETPKK